MDWIVIIIFVVVAVMFRDDGACRKLSRFLISIGCVLAYVALSSDTTYRGMHNIGLMNQQQNWVLISIALFIGGIILYSNAKPNDGGDGQNEDEGREEIDTETASKHPLFLYVDEFINKIVAMDKKRFFVAFFVFICTSLPLLAISPWMMLVNFCGISYYALRSSPDKLIMARLLKFNMFFLTALLCLATFTVAGIYGEAEDLNESWSFLFVLIPIILFLIPAFISYLWISRINGVP